MPPPPKSIKDILAEFNEKFRWANFCWNGDNINGVESAKRQRENVRSFLRKAIEQVFEATKVEKRKIIYSADEALPSERQVWENGGYNEALSHLEANQKKFLEE